MRHKIKNKKPVAPTPQQQELIHSAMLLHQSGKLAEAAAQYNSLLTVLPNNAILLTGLGTIALQQGRFEDAIRILGKSLKVDCNQPNVINNQGVAFKQLKRWREALACYDSAIALKPDYTMAYCNRGAACFELKRLDEAVASYDRAIALNPNYADAYSNRGVALKDLNRLDDALASLDKAIALNPDLAVANYNRGNVLAALNRLEEALVSYDRAIVLNPGYAEAYSNRANVLKDLSRLDEALAGYDTAIALHPGYAAAYYNRGNVLFQLKRPDEALVSYDKAIALDVIHAEAHYNRGNALFELKRLEEALAGFDRAIVINPGCAEYHSNRGLALKHLNRPEEALASYDRAVAINQDFAEAYSNRGGTLKDLNRLDEALANYDRALALQPDFAVAYWNKALLKLLTGDYAEGWRLYEWRWRRAESPARKFAQPLWLGEQPLAGKSLLIHPEQGLGDYLQFIRYAALAGQLGAKVILEAPAPLMGIVSSLEGDFTLVEAGQALPDFDYHCPLMSLPLAFNSVLETIPAQIPYLYADQAKRQLWRQRLGEKSGLRVGLVCSGAAEHQNDSNRSVAMERFAGLLDLPVEFHCLQKEIRAEDAAFMAGNSKIQNHQPLLHDFSDTAALLAEMDLLISVDTGVAHLAGALGQKVWILLPYMPDYRWLLDRADSPWYPTVTLYRQSVIGDWDGVISEIAGHFEKLMAC
ncbi:MAG: tetratricopeptide repeat protein [Methylococcales bacterium]|nr:tetratricopeptide repeat protein [Methylococcales bacterium]